MHGLEQGITQLANHEMNAKLRSNAISLLESIIDDINAGIKVWEGFSASDAGDSEPGAFAGWAGFTIERDLFEIDLNARDKAKEASGGRSSLDDPLIELAYSKLGDSQAVSDHVEAAIDAMNDRIKKVKELIAQIKNTKPKKLASAAAKPASKPAKKKTKQKKSTKKAKKKSAKKKAVKKKAVKKKPAKKKAAKKKKASKKKSVKKKAAKKKTAKKKAVKKKASRKKAAKKKKARRR